MKQEILLKALKTLDFQVMWTMWTMWMKKWVSIGQRSHIHSKNQGKTSIGMKWTNIKNIHIFNRKKYPIKMWIMWTTKFQADFRRFLQHLRPP